MRKVTPILVSYKVKCSNVEWILSLILWPRLISLLIGWRVPAPTLSLVRLTAPAPAPGVSLISGQWSLDCGLSNMTPCHSSDWD